MSEKAKKPTAPKTPAVTATEPAVPVVPATPAEIVAAKYAKKGWQVMSFSVGYNDLIAKSAPNKQGHSRVHFIQVMTPETENDARYGREARGQFVQNAFSNNAEPVYALVKKQKVSLTNVNLEKRVRL